jgi:hypothetical protein
LFTTPLSQWNKGVKHNIGIGLPSFRLLKYINVSPSVNYGETWHFNYIERYWLDGYSTLNDNNQQIWVPGHVEEVQKDGFRRTYQYSYGFSSSTILYGLYQMKNPNSKIKGIRHTITPSAGFNVTPDFTDPKFRFYDTVQTDSLGKTTSYSYYSKTSYPYSAGGRSGSVSFRLGNNIEMKVLDTKDTSSVQATRKIPIFEDLSFGGSYNLFADSMRLSTIGWSMRTKIAGFPLSINGTIDPYAVNERGNRINKYMWTEGKGLSRIGRLVNASTGFSYSLSSDKLKKKSEERRKKQLPNTEQQNPETEETVLEPEGPSFDMPWQFSFNYGLNYNHNGLKPQINQSLNFSGNIDVTSKWKANLSSSFNFATRKIDNMSMGVSRSLHCWNMSFQFSPIGRSKYYMFSLNANSSMLKDIKIDKTSRQF